MSVAVVTGANRGIGLELCRELIDKGHEVFAVCRSSSEELANLGVKKIVEDVDVTDLESLKKLQKELSGVKVDLLINNAGYMSQNRFPELDYEEIEKQFAINAVGPLKTTQTLVNSLEKGSKVVMISSRMGSIADNSSGGSYGYRMSKAAINAASKSLALDMKDHGVGVYVIHPGYVKTRMTGKTGDLTPDEAAKRILQTVEKRTLDDSGGFWHSNGEELPW